jgi:hypothetical protein
MMNSHQRTSQVLIVAGFCVSAFIGSADATAPNAPVTVTPAPAAEIQEISVNVSRDPALAAGSSTREESAGSSLLPIRKAHAGVDVDLFAGHSWYTPPPAPPVRELPPPAPRKPTAPPLPFSYIGRYEQDGMATLFYLVKDDRVYDVKLGDVIEDTYRLDKVVKGQLMFTYLPLNSSQGLRLGDE